MSQQNAEKLLEKCKADQALSKKFKQAAAVSFEALSKEAGLPCTLKEMEEAVSKSVKSGDLSDAELQSVSGGAYCARCSAGF